MTLIRLNIILFFLSLFVYTRAFPQCPATCDVEIITDQSAGYTVTAPDTHCVRTTGAATSVTFQGTVRVEKSGGVLMLCPEAGDSVIFEASFLGSNGSYTIGTANIVNYGKAVFSMGATAIDKTSLHNYGTVYIDNLDTDVFAFRDDSEVYNYGTIISDTALTTDGVFQNDSIYIDGKFTIADDAVVTNQRGSHIVASLDGTIAGKLDNNGKILFGEGFLTQSGSIINNYINGSIDIGGALNVSSGSDTLRNEGSMRIRGNASFNGNYYNSGSIIVDALLTINAGGSVVFDGGYIHTKDVRFNSGTVTATAGKCGLFIVTDSSLVASSGFTPSGVLVLIDSSDNSGTGLDHEVCGSADRSDANDSCGLYLKSADVTDCYNAILPVDLLSFDAFYINKEVKLAWITASETNNSHFTVLRSIDGITWQEIGEVSGQGNTSEVTHYSFIDPNPAGGVFYYRLQQTDFDGSTSFSHIEVLNIVDLEIYTIYPNPVDGFGQVLLYSSIHGNVTFEIIDVLGRTVQRKDIAIQKGKNTIDFSLPNAAMGIHFARMSSPQLGVSVSKRFEVRSR